MLEAISHFHKLHCKDTGIAQLLLDEQRKKYLNELSQWNFSSEQQKIFRQFKFKNYIETLEFINAVAKIAQQENHHPNIEFAYNTCSINYTTHSAAGVTQYDFICAAHIDQI